MKHRAPRLAGLVLSIVLLASGTSSYGGGIPTFDGAVLARLAAAATVVERPFASTVPLLGPLIARFRTAWNNVASRWYVHHVVEQQNAFNALAVRQLETYELELREQLALLEEQVVEQEELRRRVQELAAQVAALRRTKE